MPRFKDENDFRDVEIPVIDRPSISNEVVWSYKTDVTSFVNDPEAGSARRFDSDVQEANRLPSPKPDGFDDSESDEFVEVSRSTDNRRTFNRSSKAWPSTLWGTSARTSVNNRWLPVFRNPAEVIPCVERKVRREVLFAKRKHGGKHRKKRYNRRTLWSHIGC